jgi:hypothetical protein
MEKVRGDFVGIWNSAVIYDPGGVWAYVYGDKEGL